MPDCASICCFCCETIYATISYGLVHTSVETVFDSFKLDTEAELATLEVQFYMDVRICNHKLSVAVTTYVQTKSIPIQRSRIK